jgi:ElaB/YqjD/DUF883 family membrane-anchored ribosome-binding protein
MSRYSDERRLGASDWLVSAVKNNPEGLLLLAAGCALLMRKRSGGPARSPGDLGAGTGHYGQERFERQMPSGGYAGGGERSIGTRLSQATDAAREYTSELMDTATEAASSYASSGTQYADQARRALSEQSGRFAQQAQSTMRQTINHVVQERPLAVALVGFAAGAAIAAAFPLTELEKETLGPAGERLTDVAGRAGEQLKGAAAKAGEKLMTAAEERGLSTEGLKEMTREAAGEFGRAFSGENASEVASPRPEGAGGTRAPSFGGVGRSSTENRSGEDSPKPSQPQGSTVMRPPGQSSRSLGSSASSVGTGTGRLESQPTKPAGKRGDQ